MNHNHEHDEGNGNFGLHLHVELECGGSVTVDGLGLTIDDINEVFTMLSGKVVTGHQLERTLIGEDPEK